MKFNMVSQNSLTLTREKVRQLYSFAPTMLLINVGISAPFALFQRQVVGNKDAAIWFSLIMLMVVSRLVLISVYRHWQAREDQGQVGVLNHTHWLWFARVGIMFSGLVWGLSGLFMFPDQSIAHQAILAGILAGMCSGSIMALSIDLLAIISFLVLTLSVTVIQFFNQSGSLSMALGVMGLMYLLFSIFVALRTHRTLLENIHLRIFATAREQMLRQSIDRLNHAQQVAHLGSFEWDPVADDLQWSDGHFRLWGVEPQSQIPDYQLFISRVHPEDKEKVAEQIEGALSGGRFYDYEHRVIWPDGSLHHIHGIGEVEFDADGQAVKMRGTVQDISEARHKEEQLRIAAIAMDSQEAILITDVDLNIIKVNPAFCRITGYIDQECLGQKPDALLRSNYHDDAFHIEMWESLKKNNYWQGEVWSRRNNDEVFPDWMTITAVVDQAGSITHYVYSFTDISDQKKAEETIHNLAFFDPLTDLPNRRLLLDGLQQTLISSFRNKRNGAVLFIDLDNFKGINDTQGHSVGDAMLVEVSQRLRESVRDDDTVARLGGDEFVIILKDLNQDKELAAVQAENIAKKIRLEISQPYVLDTHEYATTPSIGIALFGQQSMDADELLKRADIAMYQAKGAGRNSIRFFDPVTQAAIRERVEMERDLRRAVKEKQLHLYYQMQVNDAQEVVGAEALLRWHHPKRGMVSPMDFIPLAEQSGLIIPIGHWVIESACRQLQKWSTDPTKQHLHLAVNVSVRQFYQPVFVENVLGLIQRFNVDPNLLKLELTESLVLDNMHDSIVKMNALRDNGVSFSLDDFGTGYSSLSNLSLLPLDQVKIDQSFVRTMDQNNSNAVIVKTIIRMTQSLELGVIAEGVETEQQRHFLQQSGCSLYQGYLFSKPVPLDQFEQQISRSGTWIKSPN